MLSYKDVFPFRYDSFYIILLHPMVRFRFFRVPPTCMLFGGTVPPMSVLFGGTVPPACVLFGGTVPPNNQSHKGKQNYYEFFGVKSQRLLDMGEYFVQLR